MKMDKELLIFWNHVGKEHGGLNYVKDIKKNTDLIKQQTLQLLEKNCRENKQRNIFIRHNENILVEIPPYNSDENYIIIYCINEGLQFSLGHKKKHKWWLVDIVDIEEIKPNVYVVNDLLLDISIEPSGKYHVLDVDEFEEACSLNILTKEQMIKSLKSLDKAIKVLNQTTFPETWLIELSNKYMK